MTSAAGELAPGERATRELAAGRPVDWATISLEAAGFAPDLGERLDAAVAAGALRGIHGVVVMRHGALALERYWPGEDEAWGRPLGRVEFGPETLHDLRSVSKSVVGLLYGIGLAAGELPPPETPLAEAFPDYRLDGDPLRARATVGHALTMTLGIAWDESLPYSDPRNGEIAMEQAADRIGFVLGRPMAEAPGSRWVYCGGATALLARLIARGAGRDLATIAGERLFEPLGIADWHWAKGRDGEAAAASGLRLRPRDLAKLGKLVLQQGTWTTGAHEVQVVPADWLARSFAPRVDTGEGLAYGYQWWLGRRFDSDQPWYGAFGNGGQRLTVIPSLDFALVVTAGNYNHPEAWKLPVSVIADHVGPAIVRL